MDEHTYKGYLAEKQAFEARIAELEAALEERRTEVVAWRSRVASLGLELSETKALLAIATAPKGPADNEVWLRCFTTFASGCVNAGCYIMASAADHADDALKKYRERFPR